MLDQLVGTCNLIQGHNLADVESLPPRFNCLVDVASGFNFRLGWHIVAAWLRPDLAPRDRSLATVSALIASGQVAQITYHLNRAMDNGLTQTQAAEVVTHLAFYAGWPNAFSALPVAKDVFEKRAK